MVYEKVLCPYCKSDKVVRYGKNNTGKQRMMCQNPECSHKTFQLEYSNNASKPETKEKIIDMAMNGSGTREYKYLDELLKLLSEFHIGMVYANNNFAYSSRISPDKLVTGKRNIQQIERNHLTLRTRIKRLAQKTICFSKNVEIHKAVIGTFINIFFFGYVFDLSTIL